MSETALEEMTPLDEAAVLLLSLGEEQASEILRRLEPREVQRLGAAMAALGTIHHSQIQSVAERFLETVTDKTGLALGSGPYLKKSLVNALGERKAVSVLERINGGNTTGLEKLKWMDPRAIADFISEEHPQIQAIVMAYLDADQAAEVIRFLKDNKLASEVIMRIAHLDEISPGALQELSLVLEDQVNKRIENRFASIGGTKVAAEIMNNLARGSDEEIMQNIREADETLGDAIQELMFVFDNLMQVDDRGIQTLLREVSTDQLVLALKGAEAPLQEKIFTNMSKRAAELLKDDMEAKGPVRLSEVEAAQKEILLVARKLAEDGEIVLGGAGGEQMV